MRANPPARKSLGMFSSGRHPGAWASRCDGMPASGEKLPSLWRASREPVQTRPGGFSEREWVSEYLEETPLRLTRPSQTKSRDVSSRRANHDKTLANRGRLRTRGIPAVGPGGEIGVGIPQTPGFSSKTVRACFKKHHQSSSGTPTAGEACRTEAPRAQAGKTSRAFFGP